MEEKESRFTGWVHGHAELIWGALAIVFLIYAATAFVNLQRGILGPDDANIIGVFGGFFAAVATGVFCGTATARKRRARAGDRDN